MGNIRQILVKKHTTTCTVLFQDILMWIRNKPANERHFYILLTVVAVVISNWFTMDNKHWTDQFCFSLIIYSTPQNHIILAYT